MKKEEKAYEMLEAHKAINAIHEEYGIPKQLVAASIAFGVPLVIYCPSLPGDSIALTFQEEGATKPHIHLLLKISGL